MSTLTSYDDLDDSDDGDDDNDNFNNDVWFANCKLSVAVTQQFCSKVTNSISRQIIDQTPTTKIHSNNIR